MHNRLTRQDPNADRSSARWKQNPAKDPRRVKSAYRRRENLPLSSPLPFEGEALIDLELNGHWQTWKALLWNTPFFHEPLDGKIKAKLKNITVPQLPAALLENGRKRISNVEEFLNRDWLFASNFHLYTDQVLLIEKLQPIQIWSICRPKENLLPT